MDAQLQWENLLANGHIKDYKDGKGTKLTQLSNSWYQYQFCCTLHSVTEELVNISIYLKINLDKWCNM